MDTKRINVEIPASWVKPLKIKLAENETTMTEVIHKFLKGYLSLND